MNGHSNTWSDDRPFTGAGFARVDTTVSCVLTRFELRSGWSLLPFYLGFRRVRKEAKSVRGLLQSILLIENLRTCYTMSFWKDDTAIVDFATRIRSHIEEANSSFSYVTKNEKARPEIWSAQLRVWGVSCHNLSWRGFDLRSLVADQLDNKAAEVASSEDMR